MISFRIVVNMERVIQSLLGTLYKETGMFGSLIVAGKLNSRFKNKIEFKRSAIYLRAHDAVNKHTVAIISGKMNLAPTLRIGILSGNRR